jgi:ABC-type nitrate/sulfonate/bicarbonate transport system substrate-binding protein
MYAKGGDSYGILVRKNADIKDISDLRGKKVAISAGTAPVQGFDKLLKSAGIPVSAVKRVNASFTSMGPMLVQGAVDAMVGIEPYLTLTKNKMGDNGLILSRMGSLVQGGGFFFISDNWAAKHPDKLEPAVQALWASEQFVRKNPQEAATIEAEFIKADKAVVDTSFRYLTFDPTVDDFTARSFDETIKYLVDQHLIPHTVDSEKILKEARKIEADLRRKHPELLQ